MDKSSILTVVASLRPCAAVDKGVPETDLIAECTISPGQPLLQYDGIPADTRPVYNPAHIRILPRAACRGLDWGTAGNLRPVLASAQYPTNPATAVTFVGVAASVVENPRASLYYAQQSLLSAVVCGIVTVRVEGLSLDSVYGGDIVVKRSGSGRVLLHYVPEAPAAGHIKVGYLLSRITNSLAQIFVTHVATA